ncbi:MAG: adenosine deaminase family protein, partial [Myxococcota bacterium]
MTKNRVFSRQLIQCLPKTDLHVHLDGSVRMSTLIELAKKQSISLPSYTVEGLCKTVFKRQYRHLSDYLKGFAYTCAVLRDPQTLQQVSYELAQDCLAEGVCYVEVRLAPQLHMQSGLSVARVLQAVHEGLRQAAREHETSESVQLHQAPVFRFGILVCAMRMFRPGFGPYYRHVLATAGQQVSK